MTFTLTLKRSEVSGHAGSIQSPLVTYNDISEKIEAPPTGEFIWLVSGMDWLVTTTEELLNELKTAGC